MPDLRPNTSPTLLWLRRDLRLSDHPGWAAALGRGGPVIPVFIFDPIFEDYGAAPKWRLGQSLAALSRDLEAAGSRLVLRRGDAAEALDALITETGAARVVWSRLYDPRSIARDRAIKAQLRARGLDVASVNASLLFEPWEVETGQGGFYRVYTPFWKAVRDRAAPDPAPIPGGFAPPTAWPASDALEDWRLGAAMNRGAEVVARHARVGEARARQRLDDFVETRMDRYRSERDFPDRRAVSGLSENLTYGEISPGALWRVGTRAMRERDNPAQAEHFLKELVWREFAYHLLFHTPRILDANWRAEWDAFPWRGDNEDAERWRRGMTGVRMVDAGMREMYVTGVMHNRARMLTASFLTKHLMTHWTVGEAWFRECLIDWDVAANAMGWQWAAGSGPDAALYFRIFNPDIQAEKFDPDETYRKRFLASAGEDAHEDARAFFDAVPWSWGLSPSEHYPEPVIGLAQGRSRALAAYGESFPTARGSVTECLKHGRGRDRA